MAMSAPCLHATKIRRPAATLAKGTPPEGRGDASCYLEQRVVACDLEDGP